MSTLLTRDHFRNWVFERDHHQCVICHFPAVDAHHIMERRLFTADHEFGGYFLDNGASVCPNCHIKSEQTIISTERIREAAGIRKIILPEHLYDDQVYDKWGNPVLANGRRLKGELFHDESVQKILALGGVLNLFTNYVKYPRTHHLPWSLGMHDDDRMHTSTEQWNGMEVVITIKMDGENTTMYNDHIHARSIESGNHPSRTWVKNFWAGIAVGIAEGWRICGENLYAEHSIHYDDLSSYFQGFSVWDDKNRCLSWDETLEYFQLFGIAPVQQLYRGVYNESVIKKLHESLDFNRCEGYVLRPARSFTYNEFRKYVGKFVRPNHIRTTKHNWKGQPVIPNKLKSKSGS